MKELQCTIMFILIKGCLEIAFQTVNVLHTFVSEWDFASQLLKHLGRWKFCGLTHSCGRAEDECGRACFHRTDKSSHPPWIQSLQIRCCKTYSPRVRDSWKDASAEETWLLLLNHHGEFGEAEVWTTLTRWAETISDVFKWFCVIKYFWLVVKDKQGH